MWTPIEQHFDDCRLGRIVTTEPTQDAGATGPGADLVEAYERGYFERIGAPYVPSEIAGSWVVG